MIIILVTNLGLFANKTMSILYILISLNGYGQKYQISLKEIVTVKWDHIKLEIINETI